MGIEKIDIEYKDKDKVNTVSIDPKTLFGDGMKPDLDIKVKFVDSVDHSSIPARFGFDEYIRQSVRGEVPFDKHDEFLHIIYEPFKRTVGGIDGFWLGTDTDSSSRNLIETYSGIFSECFGEKGRNLVTSPNFVRDIVDRIFIDGKTYVEYYNMRQINKMNYLEIVCEIIDNISKGEIARSFLDKGQEHIVATYRPEGKDYVNVYLPMSAAEDFLNISD